MKNLTDRVERLDSSPGDLKARLCKLAEDDPPAFLELLGECIPDEIRGPDGRCVRTELSDKVLMAIAAASKP